MSDVSEEREWDDATDQMLDRLTSLVIIATVAVACLAIATLAFDLPIYGVVSCGVAMIVITFVSLWQDDRVWHVRKANWERKTQEERQEASI